MDNQPNSVYDKDSEKPTTRPDLNILENKGLNNTSKTSANDDAGSASDALSSAAKTKAQSSTGSALSESENSSLAGSKSLFRKATSRITGGVKKNKGLALGGGLGGLALGIVFLGIMFLVPYELTHIQNVIVGFESKTEKRFEGKAARSVFSHLLRRQTKSLKARSESSAAESSSGEALAAEADALDLKSPEFQSGLDRAGITANIDAEGKLTSLTNREGTTITSEDIANNANGAFDELSRGLPEWEVGQISEFRPLLIDHVNAPFDGMPIDSEKTPNEQIESKILSGEDPASLAEASTPDKSAGSTDPAAHPTDAAGATGAAKEAQAVALDGIKKGLTEGDIMENIKGKLGSPAVLWSQVVSEFCGIEKTITEANKARIPKIMGLLMRHGAFLMSTTDQLKKGKLTAQQLNGVMTILNGTPAHTTSDGNYVESTSFANSVGWSSATGKTGGIKPNPSNLPTKIAGQGFIDKFNSSFGKTIIGPAVCGIENSPFGFFANIGLGLGQLVVAITGLADFGASDVAQQAAIAAAGYTLTNVLVPEVVKYLTPLGIYGLENGAQWLNNADAGTNLSYGDYSRRLGANPISTTDQQKLVAKANIDEQKVNSRLPVKEQLFALSNNSSLVSRFMNDIPMGKNAVVDSMLSYFTALPSTLSKSMAQVFSPHIFAADTSTLAPGQAYNIQQYSFQDNESSKYETFSNEQYLNSNISYGSKSVKRIDVLGNPATYKDSPSGDSNTNDLLHCYVDNFSDILQQINSADHNCTPPGYSFPNGTIGDYDNSNNGSVSTDQYNTALNLEICNMYADALSTSCSNIQGQVNDDIGHFRQYILDVSVMNNYVSLGNNQ